MSNQTTEHPAAEKPKVFRMTLQGKHECICLGRELVRGLGTPAYVKLLVSESYDELVFAPCNEKEGAKSKQCSSHGNANLQQGLCS